MAKILALLLFALMVLHLIRPFGVLGLRRRGDFWKIAVLAIGVMMATIMLQSQAGF